MKKHFSLICIALIAFSLIICLASCKNEGSVIPDDPWSSALYTADTELGAGEKVITLEVKVNDNSVKFTIRTDKSFVGQALIDNGLVEGDEGPYGLYVKKVNGILADYDINQTYWAFNINGEYAMTGIDTTEISEGDTYQLVYTK